MIKILLIRHALTDLTGKRLLGRTPGISLNDSGKEQSERLSERISGLPVNAIYSSPLERALETAIPITKKLNLSCIISEDFNELDFGEWTNREIDELRSDPQFIRFNTFRSITRIPNGELMAEAQCRMISGLKKLHYEHNNKTVAVISHADLIKSAIAFYAGIHIDMFHRIEISPASISIIHLYDDSVCIAGVNETSFL